MILWMVEWEDYDGHGNLGLFDSKEAAKRARDKLVERRDQGVGDYSVVPYKVNCPEWTGEGDHDSVYVYPEPMSGEEQQRLDSMLNECFDEEGNVLQ